MIISAFLYPGLLSCFRAGAVEVIKLLKIDIFARI